ncbi:MAG: FAD-dependent oxidoreductase [Actinobacteria bacterium]|nr:FAD-dependent oxidoreductase [Actinomycetota bacterium]
MDFDCIVIGAGLSGLTASRKLERYGKSVLLLESTNQVGGRVRSDFIDGYICDRGFQVINPKYPQVAKSGVINQLDLKKISSKVRIDELNLNIGYSLGSFSNKIGSINEKLRFLNFVFSKKVSNSIEFGKYVVRFSNLYQHALEPFLSGVVLTDPRQIAADVIQEILQSFVKSLPGVPALGVGEFPKALAKPLKNLALGELVESISPNCVTTRSTSYKARYIVVATDSISASNLVLHLKTPQQLTSTTAYFSTDEKITNSKNLVVSKNSKLVNSIVISEVSKKYAPTGKSLVSATTLTNLTEKEFKDELGKLWQINPNRWESVAKYEIKNSLPLHLPGKKKISKFQIDDWLFLIGDHMGIPSQQGAMNTGELVANKINQLMQ